MKTKKKYILLFLAIICIVIGVTVYNYVEELDRKDRIKNIKDTTIHEQTETLDEYKNSISKNDISILAIGNSDLYSGLNPLQLWHEKGYTCYISGEPSQDIYRAYITLKETLKFQRPSLIIFDVDEIFNGERMDEESALVHVAMNTFPIAQEYSLWKNLRASDFKNVKNYDKNYLLRMKTKGYLYKTKIVARKTKDSYMKNTNKIAKIQDNVKNDLKKMISLAKEKDIKLLFIAIPSARSWTVQKHNAINQIANQYNIPFLDLNLKLNDIDIDWNKDSRDGGTHLNYNGAKKATKYIGDYIQNNYNIIDYRNNSIMKEWDKEYEKFINSR